MQVDGMFLGRKRPTVNDLLERFRSVHLPTVSTGTRRRYELDIRERIAPALGSIPLSKLDTLALATFRAGLMKNLSPKSVNNCTILLSLVLTKGVEWQILQREVLAPAPLKLPESKYNWWDRKEWVARFLEVARETEYYAAYKLALECGLRLGEIVGLSKRDVDLKRCQIHIHRQWVEADNAFGPTKSGKERFVGFSPDSDLRAALGEAILRSPDPEAIFVNSVGRRIHPTKLRCKEFPKVVRAAMVPRIRFHDLRHTFASWYMIEHDNIFSLQKILGHADISTTQRYAHLSQQHLKIPTLCWLG